MEITPEPMQPGRWPQLVRIGGNRHVKYHQTEHSEWNQEIYFKNSSEPLNVTMEANFLDSCLWEGKVEVSRACRRQLPPNDPYIQTMGDIWRSPYPITRAPWSEMGWTKQECTLKDPLRYTRRMQFTNVIAFGEKYYGLSLQGSLVTMERAHSCFVVTGIGGSRGVPSKSSRQFREYFFEYNWEILLVFLVSKKSINVVDDVEAFQLDIAKLLWVKVESLGDCTLFLADECSMGVVASKAGCRSDCIYFTHHRANNWFLYEMGTGQISPDS